MIDFKNAEYFKLRGVGNEAFAPLIGPMLVGGEVVIASFQGIRDGVVFTNKRIISINIQGITGKKKDFTSMPYCKIQLFSVETAGVLDFDSEIDIWFSGAGKVRFEFTANTDITQLCRLISEHVL